MALSRVRRHGVAYLGVAVARGGISSLYIDMMLATSGIASGDESYGDCLSEFFNVLVRQEVHGLSDPAGGSGVILASSSWSRSSSR